MTTSSHGKSRTILGRAITFLLAISATALASPGVSHAKPAPGAPLNATVCKAISGTWSLETCTIPADRSGVASSSFKIGETVRLDIRGSLTINPGVIVANAGTITVKNDGGIAPGDFHDWETGILIFGTLDNSGTIDIANAINPATDAGTAGITVSTLVTATDGGATEPSPYVVSPGTFINSGTVTLNNGPATRGITILGNLMNTASGTIAINTYGTHSAGLYVRRDTPAGEDKFVVTGNLSSSGKITVSSSGKSALNSDNKMQFAYGIYNQGVFTNSAPGIFTINPSPSTDPTDDSRGLFNGGVFTNFATFINNRGVVPSEPEGADPELFNWGSYNIGTMVNYGTTTASGMFLNTLVMINVGTITSTGIFYDVTMDETMVNYGTFYNYGLIGGGQNHGICIDEQSVNPLATGC